MDSDRWQQLEDHVREHGILHPLGLEWSNQDGFAYLGEGHHRLVVARKLGMDRVPVMVCRRQSPLQGRAQGSWFAGHYEGPERDVWDKPRAPDIFGPGDIGLPTLPPPLHDLGRAAGESPSGPGDTTRSAGEL
jgi:hypothetical protein